MMGPVTRTADVPDIRASLVDLDLTAAIQARSETNLALETINFQQAFDTEGQAKLIAFTRQGNNTHVAQPWLVGFDEIFDGLTGLAQGVVQAKAHVIEIG